MNDNTNRTENGEYSDNAVIATLQLKVKTVSDTIQEIKDAIKRIEEIVGVIRIIEVQSKQQSKDFEKLVTTLHNLHKSLGEVESTLSTDITKGLDALKIKIQSVEETSAKNLKEYDVATSKSMKELKETLDALSKDWTAKYNIGKGIWMALSFVVLISGGLVVSVIQNQSSKIESNYNWVERQKIEQEVINKQNAQKPNSSSQTSAAAQPSAKTP